MSGKTGRIATGASAPRPWLSSLACGCILALTAVAAAPIAGMSIQWIPNGDSGDINVLALFTGVVLTGWLLWWLLVGRPGQAGALRGGVTGLLVACLSYPTVLFLAEFFQPDWQSRSGAPSLLERLEHVLSLSGFGLVTTGFAATIILALAGMLVGVIQGRLAGRGAESAARPRGILGRAFRALAFGATAVVVLLLAAFIWLSLLPIERLAPQTAFPPAASYAQAIAAFAAVRQREAKMELHLRCGSMLLTHGERVERVVVFFHGLTNCPAQADELAPFLFAQSRSPYAGAGRRHGR